MSKFLIVAACLLSTTTLLGVKVEEPLPNPGFENGASGWLWGSEDRKREFSLLTSSAAHSGSSGLRVVKEGENGGSSVCSAKFKVTPGEACTLRYWIRTSRSGSAAIYLRFYNQDKKTTEFVQGIPSQSEGWAEKIIKAKVPEDALSGEVWIHAATKGDVAFDVDDFSLTLGDADDVSKNADGERLKSIAAMLDKAPAGMGPQISDRAAWMSYGSQPAFKNIVQLAEFELKQPMPALSDDLYLEYSKTGVRMNNDAANSRIRERLKLLVLAECLEDKGRFLPEIEKMATIEFGLKTWVGAAHDKDLVNFNGQLTEIDLYAALMASSLATTDWLLQDRLKPETRSQIRKEIQRRIFSPYLQSVRTDSKEGMIGWWRHCTNNWNVTCHANVTAAALMLVESAQERAGFIVAAEEGTKHYLDGITDEGFSSEGLGYGQRAFGDYEILAEDVLKATHQQVSLYSNEKVKRLAQFTVRMEMLPGQYPAFGDCWARVKPLRWILNIANTRYGFGWNRWEQKPLMDLGDNLHVSAVILNLDHTSAPQNKLTTWETQVPVRQVREWFAESGILISRPNEDNGSLALAVKGGHSANNRGHEHADLGSFVVALNKKVLLVDPGAPVYTSTTFGGQRFENPIVNSYGHSAPLVAGKSQKNDTATSEILGKDFTDDRDTLSINLKDAYAVPSLLSLTRRISYERRDRGAITITDHVVFDSPQEFGVALMTFSRWRLLESNKMLVYEAPSELEITIDTGGVPFAITEEILKEAPEPRRLGINLKSKVLEATITMHIAPKAQPSTMANDMDLDLSGIKLDLNRCLLISAASFSKETGGAVQAVNKKGATGLVLKSWDNVGHELAWDITIPEDGLYAFKLRYCHDRPKESLRELQVDGKAVTQAQAVYSFPKTGGWSTESDDWRETFFLYEKKPATVYLQKGRHELCLINRGGSMNLDWVKVIPAAPEAK